MWRMVRRLRSSLIFSDSTPYRKYMLQAHVGGVASRHGSSTVEMLLLVSIDLCSNLPSLGLCTTGGKLCVLLRRNYVVSVHVCEGLRQVRTGFERGKLQHTSLTSRSFQVLLLIFIGLLPRYFPFCSRKALSMSILKIGPYRSSVNSGKWGTNRRGMVSVCQKRHLEQHMCSGSTDVASSTAMRMMSNPLVRIVDEIEQSRKTFCFWRVIFATWPKLPRTLKKHFCTSQRIRST